MNKNLLNNPKRMILSLAGILLLVFSLVFYKEDQFKALFKSARPDNISVIYLQLLLNINPNNRSLRLELARHHMNLGQDNQARVELDKVSTGSDSEEAIHARILMLEIDFKQYFSIAENDPIREKVLKDLQNRITMIGEKKIPPELLDQAIQLSLELNQPKTAADLYYYWSTLAADTTTQIERLEKSAHWYLAADYVNKTAAIYHQCFEIVSIGAQARQFALSVLQSLKNTGDIPLAVAYFNIYQQEFPDDPEFLDSLIAVTQAGNDEKYAYQLGISRLQLDPNNPEQVSKQFERALAAGEIQSALILTKQLIKITPDDEKIHENLAKIAGWLAAPELALSEWLWLARNRNDEISIQNAIQLANGLKRYDEVIEMLQQQANLRELSPAELDNLLYAYTQIGRKGWTAFLESYIKRYPGNTRGWDLLAEAYENNGRFDQAAEVWEQIGTRFARPLDAATNRARLMWKNNQSKDALLILLNSQLLANEEDTQFWETLGEISWELKESQHTLRAYHTLWQAESTNVIVPERLILLNRESGKTDEAVEIGKQAYERFNEPRWLLLAMDVANQANSTAQLKQLIALADHEISKFENLEMYWLLHAQLDIREKQLELATKHYKRALQVNPESIIAKEGILWNLIDHNDLHSLSRYLKKWRSTALKTPQLWGVFGIGLLQSNRSNEALPWLKKKAKVDSGDYLWALTYADALESLGQVDHALNMRRYALLNIRSDFNEQKYSKPAIKKILHPQYLTLIRALEGLEAEESLLKKIFAKKYDDPIVEELLVSAYLTQKNLPQARFWLLKNHVKRQQTPTWQRLSLALLEKDLVTAQQILETENTALTAFNKMEISRLHNRNVQALQQIYGLLEANKNPQLQANLFQIRDELAIKTSKQAMAGLDYKSLGEVNLMESRARFTMPYFRSALALDFKHTLLNSDRQDLIIPRNEIDIAAEFYRHFQQGSFQVNFGGNFRDNHSLPYGNFKIHYDFDYKLKANMRFGVNEMSYETAALRALAAKDSILFGLTSQPAQPVFLNVEIDGHRYHTRAGSTLGKGYKVQSILGTSILSGEQGWQVRLQGSWEDNYLPKTLPSELAGLLGDGHENIKTLVPDKFGLLGAGTSVRLGASNQGILRRPFLMTDAWVGWVWPADTLGYNGRISTGISLFGPDILSVGAFYSNVQGGRTSQAFTGGAIQYQVRF